MSTAKKYLLWAAGTIVVFALYFVGQYNSLAQGQEEIASRSADIAAQLQRRCDLIPNLVASVKRFTEHEKEVLDKVLEARQALAGAQGMAALAEGEAALQTALRGLSVVVENYPELKSDAVYTSLMDELAGSENRIAVARVYYNASVQSYNSKLVSFPSNFIARLAGFGRAPLFEASPQAATVPSVGGLL